MVYLLPLLVDFYDKFVGRYTIPMDPMRCMYLVKTLVVFP